MWKAPIIACGVFMASGALAQTSSPLLGEQIANENCIFCHQIVPGTEPKNPKSGAPSFVDVANLASTTELSIKVFLRSSHRSMPNFVLTPEEIDSIAAYILGLRQK
jgi:mono/diheme cytochrome c family protein